MVRDPRRMRALLTKIETLWNHHPDWRLGQLLYNAASASGINNGSQLFYIEDGRVEEGIDELERRRDGVIRRLDNEVIEMIEETVGKPIGIVGAVLTEEMFRQAFKKPTEFPKP